MRFRPPQRLHVVTGHESVALAAVQRGSALADPQMVETLQEQRGQALFGFARRLGLNDEQAADAVQESLLRLWAELHAGRPIGDLAAWCFGTLYRIAMDEHRLSRRVAGLRERLVHGGKQPPAEAQGNEAHHDRLLVWAEIDRLPARERHVLYLRYRADLAFEQIAPVLGISVGAARMLASRALDRVRRRLTGPEGGS